MMTGTDLIKVSIIVPVYNTAKYLPQCLDSILSQTMPNFEVICVDDGSTDDSLKILYEYAAKDGRVRVVQQDNMTAGAARNRGMDLAVGEYLLFLDSDDFFSPDLVETAYLLAKGKEADVVIFGADNYDDVTNTHIEAPWYVREAYLPVEQPFAGRDIADTIIHTTTSGPWNKLFRSSFIMDNNLRFQKLPNTNDLCFVMAALMLAERIAWTTTPLVSYRRGMTSNTQSKRDLAPTAFFEALQGLKAELISHNVFSIFEKAFQEFARNTCEYNFNAISLDALGVNKRAEIEKSLGLQSTYAGEKKYPSGPKISICVAVYNTAEYLRTCMESLIGQTYSNIEIICVNDGSTDNSLEILREYEKKDNRVIVLNKEKNEKLMLARVSALDVATGDYVVFVDSDDYLDTDAMNTVAAAILIHDVDIIQFECIADVMSDDKSYETWFQKQSQPMEQRIAGIDYLKHTYLTRKISTSLLGKAYRIAVLRSAYSRIPQEEIYVGEDVYAMFFIAIYTKSYIGIRSKPLYHYRYGLGIGNMGKMSLEKFSLYCDMAHLVDNVQQFLQENHYTSLQWDAYQQMGERLLDDVLNILRRKRLEDEDVRQAEVMIIKEWQTFPGVQTRIESALGVNPVQVLNDFMGVPVYERPAHRLYEHGKTPLVSVIIPVFNTEKYLHECLESVLNQANADVEVICINDGSYDESLTIIEEYYGKHDNISVVSGKNEGPSAARNAGLQLARGKYVLFVDSDDMIQTDCINRLVAIAEEKELDFVSFDADGFYDPTEELSVAARSMLDIYHRSACDKHVYTGVEMLCEQTKVHEYIASACLLFLRKSWIEEKHLRFEIGILHEDNPFVFACYLNASRCIHTQFNGYLRRIRGGSIMTGVKSINHLRGYFTAYLLMAAEARRVGVMDENHYEVQYRIKAAFDNAQALYTQLVDEKRFVPRTSFDFVMEGLLNSATPQCSEGKQDELFTFENDENHQKRRGKRAAYDLGKVPALPNMTDLNSVVKAGTYLVLHNKQDKIVGNCPTGGTYKLVVDVLTNNVLRQTLIAGNSYNMFVRSFAFGNWTEWKNIAEGNNNATAVPGGGPTKSVTFLVKRAFRFVASAFRRISF